VAAGGKTGGFSAPGGAATRLKTVSSEPSIRYSNQ
jgi:hypothetical protein